MQKYSHIVNWWGPKLKRKGGCLSFSSNFWKCIAVLVFCRIWTFHENNAKVLLSQPITWPRDGQGKADLGIKKVFTKSVLFLNLAKIFLCFWPKLLVFVLSAMERDLFKIILYFWPKLLVFVQSAVRWDWKDELAAICPDSLSVYAAS